MIIWKSPKGMNSTFHASFVECKDNFSCIAQSCFWFWRLIALIVNGIKSTRIGATVHGATMTRQKYVPWAKFMSLLNGLKCMHCSTPKIWLLLGVSCNANCGLWINISLQQFMKNYTHSLLQIRYIYLHCAIWLCKKHTNILHLKAPCLTIFISTQLQLLGKFLVNNTRQRKHLTYQM